MFWTLSPIQDQYSPIVYFIMFPNHVRYIGFMNLTFLEKNEFKFEV